MKIDFQYDGKNTLIAKVLKRVKECKRKKNQSYRNAVKPDCCQKINESYMGKTVVIEAEKNKAANGHHHKDDRQSSKELFDGTERVVKYCHV
jgi:hypothetical protein